MNYYYFNCYSTPMALILNLFLFRYPTQFLSALKLSEPHAMTWFHLVLFNYRIGSYENKRKRNQYTTCGNGLQCRLDPCGPTVIWFTSIFTSIRPQPNFLSSAISLLNCIRQFFISYSEGNIHLFLNISNVFKNKPCKKC